MEKGAAGHALVKGAGVTTLFDVNVTGGRFSEFLLPQCLPQLKSSRRRAP